MRSSYEWRGTCFPGETYMGETPHLARHAAGVRVVLLRPCACFRALLSGCCDVLFASEARSSARFNGLSIDDNLVVFTGFANSALIREIKGAADSFFLFGVEMLPPAPANVELQEGKRKPTAKHEERPAKR